MPFTLTPINRQDDWIKHLAAKGDATSLDFPSDNHLHFDKVLGPDWNTRLVLLDMDQCGYLESAAIGWLINAQRQFRLGGGLLVLHSLQPQIRNMLDLLNINRVVPLAKDEATGRKLLLSLAEMERTA